MTVESTPPTAEEFGNKGTRGRIPRVRLWLQSLTPGVPMKVPPGLQVVTDLHNQRNSLYSAAKTAGIKVSTLVRGGDVWVLRHEEKNGNGA